MERPCSAVIKALFREKLRQNHLLLLITNYMSVMLYRNKTGKGECIYW